MGRRFLREERGFTLTEMLVTTMLMIVVLFAIYSIFDISLRVFGFGNASMEATDNARMGMAKMEREIRAAYPLENASYQSGGITRNPTLFTSFGSQQITFGNDRNGNRMVDGDEVITYELSGSGPPYTLLRNSQPVVEYVQSLDFTYLTSGATTSTESAIRMVRVDLDVRVRPVC
jgi:type II secretory pathway component PulJ